MENVSHLVSSLLQLLLQLGNIIAAAVVSIELWLRGALGQFGLPPQIQTIVMLAIAAVLILGALRLFGGLIRVIVILVLILIALHIVLPVMPH